MMDTPQFLHCFAANVEPDPEQRESDTVFAVDYQVKARRITVGNSTKIHFILTDVADGRPAADMSDVSVLYYRSDGRGRRVEPAQSLGDGLYEATVRVDMPATYYVFVGAPSRNLKYTDLPFLSLMGMPAPPAESSQ
jgi:hypothetical protein